MAGSIRRSIRQWWQAEDGQARGGKSPLAGKDTNETSFRARSEALHSPQGTSVIHDGKLLVSNSRDLECDTARALLAKGITGKRHLFDNGGFEVAKMTARKRGSSLMRRRSLPTPEHQTHLERPGAQLGVPNAIRAWTPASMSAKCQQPTLGRRQS